MNLMVVCRYQAKSQLQGITQREILGSVHQNKDCNKIAAMGEEISPSNLLGRPLKPKLPTSYSLQVASLGTRPPWEWE